MIVRLTLKSLAKRHDVFGDICKFILENSIATDFNICYNPYHLCSKTEPKSQVCIIRLASKLQLALAKLILLPNDRILLLQDTYLYHIYREVKDLKEKHGQIIQLPEDYFRIQRILKSLGNGDGESPFWIDNPYTDHSQLPNVI